MMKAWNPRGGTEGSLSPLTWQMAKSQAPCQSGDWAQEPSTSNEAYLVSRKYNSTQGLEVAWYKTEGDKN